MILLMRWWMVARLELPLPRVQRVEETRRHPVTAQSAEADDDD